MSDPAAVRAMLEARSIAIVGASARPGSFGARMVDQVRRSRNRPQVHLVNPRYREVAGLPCLPSLDDVPGSVDLVLMGVGDDLLPEQLARAVARRDRSAIVFGPARGAAGEAVDAAGRAGMAVCGGGCMGFVDVAGGVRALGYVERDPLPPGPVALVTHSGSAFSALLRSRRAIGWTLAVSSGQERVTSTADYLHHVLDRSPARVVALLLETVRDAERLRSAFVTAAAQDVAVVLLPVGSSHAGAELVTAHSGAVAGDDAGWEALTRAHGLLRVRDLDEMADLLELLCLVERPLPRRPGGGLATVHDSGAERTLVADVAEAEGVPMATLSAATTRRLGELLDPGLVPGNPLDVWGRGAGTRELFASCLTAMAEDPAVSVVALAVDLVPEYDGDDSYPLAVLDAAPRTRTPMAVLSGAASSLDPVWAARLRDMSVPVLEGTRSGLRALGHLMALGEGPRVPSSTTVDAARRARWTRWAGQLAGGGAELLADYGVPTPVSVAVASRDEAVTAAGRVGGTVVLKTAEPGVAHKSDVGGVLLGLADPVAVGAAYDDLAARLGPAAVVSAQVPAGVELSVGIAPDPLLGPLVVVAAGGVLVELLADRAVALPPVDRAEARALLDALRLRPLLDGWRGGPAADVEALLSVVVAVGQIAVELGDVLLALDLNPVIASPSGAVAVDCLVLPRPAPHTGRDTP